MIIREAAAKDAEALKVLYFEHLTKYPPQEEQNMAVWKKLLAEYENDNYNYILIAEENGEVVSSVQMSIIRSMTHNVRPFAVIENVVTHADHRQKGYASALLQKATDIAKASHC